MTSFPQQVPKPRTRGEHERTFTFDTVFGFDSKQADVYNETARPIVDSVLEGYNGEPASYSASWEHAHTPSWILDLFLYISLCLPHTHTQAPSLPMDRQGRGRHTRWRGRETNLKRGELYQTHLHISLATLPSAKGRSSK